MCTLIEIMKHRKEGSFNPAFVVYIRLLRKIMADCDTILDLGCGPNSPVRFIHTPTTGVDGYEPSIKKARKHRTHDELRLMDVRDTAKAFGEKSFDAVVALDLIEHLSREDACRLLSAMERIAKRKVVIVTPNGFLPQHDDRNRLHQHVSGWSVSDFKQRGFTVYGMNGWKFLRNGANLKYKPRCFWAIVSFLSHAFFTFRRPIHAHALLALKQVDQGGLSGTVC